MIIRGNTVSTTIPRTNYEQTDPAKADYLRGKAVLDQKIADAQTAADHAQTAADHAQTAADHAQTTANSKVDKANVVNNFTTTEEGFVADARALKLLNDSRLSTELLWRNASPNSEFGVQGIAADTQKYDAVIAKFRYASSDFFDPYPQTSVLCFMYHYAIGTSAYALTDSAGITYRIFDVYDGGVWFREGHEVNTGECHNQYCIPTELYGVKFFGGVSV